MKSIVMSCSNKLMVFFEELLKINLSLILGLGFLRVTGLGLGGEVPEAHNSKAVNDNEM